MRKLIAALPLLFCLFFISCSSKSVWDDQDGMTEGELSGSYESRFSDSEIPLAEGGGPFRDVLFAYDSDKIDEAGLQDIEYNVQMLGNYPNLEIVLEGHCDERGTNEYNMALGNRRAKSVKDVLLNYGIPASRLQTISYGEEIPVDPGHTEGAWSKNRRVHFSGAQLK